MKSPTELLLARWNGGAPARERWRMRGRMRWYGLKTALASAPWQPRALDTVAGFVTERLDVALKEACRKMDIVRIGEPVRGYQGRSLGATVQTSDGTLLWLKVSGVLDEPRDWLREGELSAPTIHGVPRPAILQIHEWSVGRIHWRAILMELAPAAAGTSPVFSRRRVSVSDRWIGELKDAMRALSAVPTERRRMTEGHIAATIAQRFGTTAPRAVDDWRTAHGDIHWGNVTAPQLMLLDWESWGLAPRGFDAAFLVAYSSSDSVLTQRLLAAFAEDLDTPSGKVAQLAICADLLAQAEAGDLNPRFQAPIEALARRTLYGG